MCVCKGERERKREAERKRDRRELVYVLLPGVMQNGLYFPGRSLMSCEKRTEFSVTTLYVILRNNMHTRTYTHTGRGGVSSLKLLLFILLNNTHIHIYIYIYIYRGGALYLL